MPKIKIPESFLGFYTEKIFSVHAVQREHAIRNSTVHSSQKKLIVDVNKKKELTEFLENNQICQLSVFLTAVAAGNAAKIKELNYLDIYLENRDDKFGFTPLHTAVFACHVEVVELLLNADAPLEAKDSNDNTPLHVAASTGKVNLLRLLILAGANLNATNRIKEIPLFVAIERRHKEVIRMLLGFTSDVKVMREYVDDAIALALQTKKDEMVKSIKEYVREFEKFQELAEIRRAARLLAQGYRSISSDNNPLKSTPAEVLCMIAQECRKSNTLTEVEKDQIARAYFCKP